VRQNLERLKGFSILKGTRGMDEGDVDAFVDLVSGVSRLLAAFPVIKEIDINPVRVFARGKGCMALDARMRIE
ncbi:MAG: acetate--CoA ligase family protein, partial [Thermodesulfobacteriota bacterium]|nr:acetate--CoA ligase family protein [Thermodesulfobacteriota bacterium]